ncbi:MAG: hypothetical protein ACPIOQ_78560 [Promethearchaeia archaeon]
MQGGTFAARGTLTYTGPKLVTSRSKRLVSVQIEQTKFSSADLKQLQKLIDEDRPYRIRIQVCPDPHEPTHATDFRQRLHCKQAPAG